MISLHLAFSIEMLHIYPQMFISVISNLDGYLTAFLFYFIDFFNFH